MISLCGAYAIPTPPINPPICPQLSIIGLVLSVANILNSLAIMDIHSYYDDYSSNTGLGPGIVSLVIALFFLAFCDRVHQQASTHCKASLDEGD